MALERKNSVYVFNDRPEQTRLKGWYDQVRGTASDATTRRDASTGRFIDTKTDGHPLKGAAKKK